MFWFCISENLFLPKIKIFFLKYSGVCRIAVPNLCGLTEIVFASFSWYQQEAFSGVWTGAGFLF